MAAPDGHIRKRQFQPSTSSYFARDGTASQGRPPRSPMSPPVPDDVQSNLLSAGMRTRKAVSEGYKTHKTTSVDNIPFPSTAPAVTMTISRESSVNSRELQPFCGLHKIGGWAEQENTWTPPSSAPAAMSARDYDDDLPPLSTSQSTIRSTQGSFLSATSPSVGRINAKKRTFEEEMEDDMDAFFDEEMEAEHTPRPIARPRGQQRRALAGPPMVSDNDFEDASFLVSLDEMETGA